MRLANGCDEGCGQTERYDEIEQDQVPGIVDSVQEVEVCCLCVCVCVCVVCMCACVHVCMCGRV